MASIVNVMDTLTTMQTNVGQLKVGIKTKFIASYQNTPRPTIIPTNLDTPFTYFMNNKQTQFSGRKWPS